jgi:chemotaxis protein methyltransferase CheR
MIREEVYKFFADYIYTNTGMVYAPTEFYRLDSRINDLVRFLGATSVDDVYNMYKTKVTPDMRAILINISTNNETYFFRDVKPFSVLTKNVLPEIIEKYPAGTLNIWSAASSTGQEAYSIIMSIVNQMTPDVLSRLSISGSDISTEALKRAQSATYNGLEAQRGLPIAMLMKFFTQGENETWKFDSQLAAKAKFFEFNLLTGNFPKEAYHVIFCRNVLIYQNTENKKIILDNLYLSLKPGGYLFLGTGESLIGIDNKYERVAFENGTVYRKN